MANDKPDMAAIMATPEVQRAIADAATKAATTAVAALAEGRSELAGDPDSPTQKLFAEMALAISRMANQGTGRAKPLAPDVMQKRESAMRQCESLLEQMHANLREANHKGDQATIAKWTPEYRVVAKIYFNERLIDPWVRSEVRGAPPVPQEIQWTGMPNDALRPLNPIAEKLYDLYREAVGAAPRLAARSGPNGGQIAPDNRPYWMTPGGLVVKGSAPPKAWAAPSLDGATDGGPQRNDPTQPFEHVLGTLHKGVQVQQATGGR